MYTISAVSMSGASTPGGGCIGDGALLLETTHYTCTRTTPCILVFRCFYDVLLTCPIPGIPPAPNCNSLSIVSLFLVPSLLKDQDRIYVLYTSAIPNSSPFLNSAHLADACGEGEEAFGEQCVDEERPLRR